MICLTYLLSHWFDRCGCDLLGGRNRQIETLVRCLYYLQLGPVVVHTNKTKGLRSLS